MQFGFRARKASDPPLYAARSSRSPIIRRSRLQATLVFVLGLGFIIWLLTRIRSKPSRDHFPGSPPIVIVTVLDDRPLDQGGYKEEYLDIIKSNRDHYAKKHGYLTFFPSVRDYNLDGSPISWSRVPAMRHALTRYPNAKYVWYLEQNALIMNPDITINDHITEPKKMEAIMLRDKAVVPPDSVIKTFTHLRGDQIDFILSQDADGLAPGSFILRRGEWAKFFLDTWFDPLYRSYNFQKAETHALEHIVQWHPTILTKLALIPQKLINSYSRGTTQEAVYNDGDFLIRFIGCDKGKERDCFDELEPFYQQWRARITQG